MLKALPGPAAMVRPELRGVTSIIRALNLRPKLYDPLRKHFHSSAIKARSKAPCLFRFAQYVPHPVPGDGKFRMISFYVSCQLSDP